MGRVYVNIVFLQVSCIARRGTVKTVFNPGTATCNIDDVVLKVTTIVIAIVDTIYSTTTGIGLERAGIYSIVIYIMSRAIYIY
ncbi:hypothetical protein D3C80_1548440 [compost metagenome]